MAQIESGRNVEEAIGELDEEGMTEEEKDEALADFRKEVSLLRSLRHPNIVLMLAYSTTENTEVMISELMRVSTETCFTSFFFRQLLLDLLLDT